MSEPPVSLVAFATAACVTRTLDDIGNAVSCWRLRKESDRAFAHRLALEIQTSIIDREELLSIVLSLARSQPGGKNHDEHP